MNYKQVENIWMCFLCDRSFGSRQSVTSHIHRTHSKPGVSYGGHQKGNPAWNKGLTKQTDKRVEKNAVSVSKAMTGKIGKKHTEETKRKISLKMSINNRGGRSKWYEVAGQKVQGTWERNCAMKFEEQNIVWEKLKTNQHTFSYEINGKMRSYTPDFYLKDYDVYLEIKGRWWGDDRKKMDIVLEKYKDKKIIVVEKEKYEKILEGELVW